MISDRLVLVHRANGPGAVDIRGFLAPGADDRGRSPWSSGNRPPSVWQPGTGLLGHGRQVDGDRQWMAAVVVREDSRPACVVVWTADRAVSVPCVCWRLRAIAGIVDGSLRPHGRAGIG